MAGVYLTFATICPKILNEFDLRHQAPFHVWSNVDSWMESIHQLENTWKEVSPLYFLFSLNWGVYPWCHLLGSLFNLFVNRRKLQLCGLFLQYSLALHSVHLLRIPKGAKGAKCDQTIGPDRLFGNKATDKVIKSRNDKTLVVNLPSRLLEIQNMIKKSSLETGQENVP